MNSPQNIVAVTLLAVALTADRAVAASVGQPRPAAETLSAQIVRRLQQCFRRVVPSMNLLAICWSAGSWRPLAGLRMIESSAVAPRLLSPCQFRLPPPAGA
ncbi:MAG: hypothetical protein NZ561_05675 [Phycisphaerae bacterium]|nr:hypothetical protein [Phycisphaerae bacterium]MDW8261258.1 hypothetical protein [Phycisphaerales bacterium]